MHAFCGLVWPGNAVRRTGDPPANRCTRCTSYRVRAGSSLTAYPSLPLSLPRRAHTRDQLVAAIQQWLGAGGQEGQQGEQQDEHGVYGELQMDGVPTAAAAAGGSLAPQGHGTAACGVPQAVVIKPQV